MAQGIPMERPHTQPRPTGYRGHQARGTLQQGLPFLLCALPHLVPCSGPFSQPQSLHVLLYAARGLR